MPCLHLLSSNQLLPILFAKTLGCQIAKGGRIFWSIKCTHWHTWTWLRLEKVSNKDPEESEEQIYVLCDLVCGDYFPCWPCMVFYTPLHNSKSTDRLKMRPRALLFDAQTDKLRSKEAFDENSRSKEAPFPCNQFEVFLKEHSALQLDRVIATSHI